MPKGIKPDLKTIGDFLALEGAKCFRIPPYQREYKWGIDQCDKLWQDIWNFMGKPEDEEDIDIDDDDSDKEKYFFGTIIINCEDKDSVYELIDGQQRTTTFLLLFKALLLHINDLILKASCDTDSRILIENLKNRRQEIMSRLYHRKTDRICRLPDEKEDKKLWENSLILENHSINEDSENLDELKKILHSWTFEEAKDNVRQFKRRRGDNRFTNYFKNFKFFCGKLEKLSESKTNAFANAILDQCNLIEIKSWNVEQAIAMFNSLNSAGLPLSDANVISASLYEIAKIKNVLDDYNKKWGELQDLAKNSIVNLDAILMQHMYYTRSKTLEIGKDGSRLTTPGLRRYYTSTENGKHLLANPIKLCTDLTNLVNTWNKVSLFPVIQVLLRFNGNAKLFLASYFYRFNADSIKLENIEPVAECFLRLFALLELVETGFSNRFFKAFLFKESLQLVDENASTERIIADFDSKINEIKDYFKYENIEENIKGPCSSALVCLNEYLIAKETGTADKFRLDENTQIEHIMPNANKYRKAVMKDAGIVDLDEFNKVVDQLGNLMLLESNLNESISDNWFRCKIENGYKKSRYPRAKKLVKEYESVDKPVWNKDVIEKATEDETKRILKFIFNS